jgi:hypothetical protein
MNMKPAAPVSLEGVFQHLIYSPRGDVEGALVECAGEPTQLAVAKGDERLAQHLQALVAGQTLVVKARPQGPSPKGASAHPVFEAGELLKVDGARPGKPKPTAAAGYAGQVVRLNYARHGEANGVVLDSGDFIHLKPDGMARLKLKVGDAVDAEGDAQRLVDDSGWAVEATRVNGKPVKRP